MKWPLEDLRKGIVPEELFNNGKLPKAVVEGRLTRRNVRDAIFRFGFPVCFRINRGGLHILAREEDVDALLAKLPRSKQYMKLSLERPASIPTAFGLGKKRYRG